MKKGFSLLELLIVIGIIATLITLESFVFANSQKSARDGRRKADLENVRAAVEQYRSNNNTYPPSASVAFGYSCSSAANTAGLTDANNITYIKPLPYDPRCNLYAYDYNAYPTGCNGTTVICNDYVIGARLEGVSATTCVDTSIATDCRNSGTTGQNCNYCLGPYGVK